MADKKEFNNKVCFNSLMLEKFVKLSKEERQKAVKILLKTKTERQLQDELGIPHSTLHDWKSGRQDNTGNNQHISIDKMIEKLDGYKPRLDEFPKLEKLRAIIDSILNKKY